MSFFYPSDVLGSPLRCIIKLTTSFPVLISILILPFLYLFAKLWAIILSILLHPFLIAKLTDIGLWHEFCFILSNATFSADTDIRLIYRMANAFTEITLIGCEAFFTFCASLVEPLERLFFVAVPAELCFHDHLHFFLKYVGVLITYL